VFGSNDEFVLILMRSMRSLLLLVFEIDEIVTVACIEIDEIVIDVCMRDR